MAVNLSLGVVVGEMEGIHLKLITWDVKKPRQLCKRRMWKPIQTSQSFLNVNKTPLGSAEAHPLLRKHHVFSFENKK